MLARFLEHIKKNSLCGKSAKILLAVSGGADSVVMAELFHRAGYKFGIIHCNFRLRGKESDADEAFVRDLAIKKYQVPFFVTHFDTKKFAEQNKLSIQEAARELRYAYFEEIRIKEHFSSIATAHHADDRIETFFINLLRGSGISGLAGIPVKQKNIIRPLLFAFRSEIEAFAAINKLKYRTDSSNKDSKYLRNKIRNKLLPVMEQIYPNYRNAVNTSITNLRNTEVIYRAYLEKISLVKTNKNGLITISIKELKKLEPASHYLFEFISAFGFNKYVCEDICNSLDEVSGKIFLSPSHRLVKDRENLIIEQLATEAPGRIFFLNDGVKQISHPIKLKLAVKKSSGIKAFSEDKNMALLDKDRLVFPLTLRKWQKGDYFYPLGMKGKKKLSDFFTDHKFSVIDKENTWLLCSEDKIVWVIGWRIDERFKISAKTQNMLQVKWLG
ncbi:MAG TPA: tRNA lysidine(34) synthetase TilS [Bacteroidales bacterium]|nr:tRNA lysidine(34) synthetase TilS [Bacteroidales bacterium]